MKARLDKAIDLANELKLMATERLMLLVLIVMAGDKKSVCASYTDISACHGAHPRNCIRLVTILKERYVNVLKAEATQTAGGRNRANLYTFPFLDGTGTEPIAPLRDDLEGM